MWGGTVGINMCNKTFVNSFGLAVGMIGAMLIYKFQLPVKFDDGHMYLDVDEKGGIPKKYVYFTKLGLLCLAIGFGLQLISNFLND